MSEDFRQYVVQRDEELAHARALAREDLQRKLQNRDESVTRHLTTQDSPAGSARLTSASAPTQKGKADYTGIIDGTGYKVSMDDARKYPITLIPPIILRLIALVLQFGARKYARGQWMRGMSYSEVLDAMGRHWSAIVEGEDIDPDSGLPHLGHIGCCIAFLAWYQYGPRWREYRHFDDRQFGYTPGESVPPSHYSEWNRAHERVEHATQRSKLIEQHDHETCEGPRGCA